jgi:hypothetical protein
VPITKQAKIILGIEDVEVWNKRSEANIFFSPSDKIFFSACMFFGSTSQCHMP